ncbi:cysteine desulfurase [Alcaligenes pakistanensis]|uniref:cysteine desulfurase n=1 Tax=Alcaligenes pakistanensis TaxID=1482717 RepID=A0A8H9IT07_9BURK|nr:cysteine desulfurase [Alcaligenes pakistanensis]GHC58806.1 cysteine desulfurase [Alcaligenes pakistanensis]HCA17295.1 cysteine desulfurase CsdA [Alcaligenes faecalis]
MNAPMPVTATGLLNHREDFPILARPIRGQRLSYLDNGATTQKPRSVIEAEARFYEQSNANIHRGVHWLSQHATELYDQARSTVRAFLNAARDEEIVFTRGTTESINLVAYSWGMDNLKAGDEILLTGLEHHSNIVPWQLVAQRTGAVIRVVPVLDNGELDQEAFKQLLNEKTRLLAVGHVSNALGTINPIAEMTRQAHAVGAKVLVDGAQSVPHGVVDVQALDADFYTFSAHKLYGPTGMGALYVRYEILDSMSPWMGGGDMITTVSFEQSNYAPVPQRFEAGTPNIAGAITMAAAIDYLMAIGMQRIADHEAVLLEYATDALLAMPGIRIIGTAAHKAGIVSFLVDGIHPHDLGTILDMDGVAVRAGHHCAMPLMTRFGIPGTARASFALYNDYADIDALLGSLRKAQKLFGVG